MEPDFETLVRLADFFDTSTDYILGRNRSFIPADVRSTSGLAQVFPALPKAAVKELESYIEYLHYKYNNRENKDAGVEIK